MPRKNHGPSLSLCSVLLANANEPQTKTDRACLRQFPGIEVAWRASGAAAAHYLLHNEVDLVVCGDALTDMNGTTFIRLLRSHPRLTSLPVLLASADNSKTAVLGAQAAGCSGYLIRPYSLQGFARQTVGALRSASLQPESKPEPAEECSEEAFQQLLAQCARTAQETVDPATPFLDKGMRLLNGGQYAAAMRQFEEAARRNPRLPEVFVGMARACKGQGSRSDFRHFLGKAMALYASQHQFDKARELFDELLLCDPLAPNPFLLQVSALIKRGSYKQAAAACERALFLHPESNEVYAHIARACHFTPHPTQAAMEMARALSRTGAFPTSRTVYARIMGDSDLAGQSSAQPAKGRRQSHPERPAGRGQIHLRRLPQGRPVPGSRIGPPHLRRSSS